jgi:hypothetical protein
VSLDISIDSLCIDLGDFQKEVSLDITIDSLCIDLAEFQKEVSLDISIGNSPRSIHRLSIMMSRITSF